MVQKNAEALDWHRADVVAVSTRSRPKAADESVVEAYAWDLVSTRSRPKAAGRANSHRSRLGGRFNSQPPEGGWTPVYKVQS